MTLCLTLLILLSSVTLSLASAYNFTTIDVAGAASTIAMGINNTGQIVGSYTNPDNWEHGFLLSGGALTTINYPNTIASGPGYWGGTRLNGINDSGVIVGGHGPVSIGVSYGFTYSGVTFTAFPTQSGTLGSQINGINNAGTKVGGSEWPDGIAPVYAFINDGSGTVTHNPPQSSGSSAYGINNSGWVVGNFQGSSGVGHGFLYKGGSSFTTIDDPLASGSSWTRTMAMAINDAGNIVGRYDGADGKTHGFLLVGDVFTTIDVPNATSTNVSGINNAGEIVGWYLDSAGHQHGYSANPVPLPGSLLLLGSGLLGLAGWRRFAQVR